MDITKKLEKYLKTETTTTGDIALPPDKASSDTKAGKTKFAKRKGKRRLLIDEPSLDDAKKPKGGSS